MSDLSKLILKKVLDDDMFCRRALPYLQAGYFEGEYRVVYKLLIKYISEYNSRPSKPALEYEFGNSDFNVEANAGCHELIDQIYNVTEEERSIDKTWMLDKTEEWCKERALHNAILKAIGIIDGQESKFTRGAIPEILTTALGVSFDQNIGHDYIDNAKERYEYYNRVENKIPFDLEMLNKITKGGVSDGTLNILMAGTGAGKSLTLCHFAAANISIGKNVLYITLEMAEEKIAERIDANLFDIDIASVDALSEKNFQSHLDKVKAKVNGKLIIKQYPTAGAHTGHFRALIDELRLKKDFVPDIIYVDYLNICASSRLKNSGETYSYIKSIAEELRGLAIEVGVPIWSATQTNRSGQNNSDIDLSNTSESFGLPATADLFLAIISTEELEDLEQIMFKQLKNRYNDVTLYRRFVVGIDKSRMRLYDAEDEAQDDIMPETTKRPDTNKGTNSFSEFKFD
jgi:archaellum biogenesis ATPase FlaH